MPVDPRAFIAAASACADPTRLRMLFRLAGGPLRVGQLAAAIGVTQPAISYHVALLRQAGLVSAHREGSRTIVRRNERRWAAVEQAFGTTAWEA